MRAANFVVRVPSAKVTLADVFDPVPTPRVGSVSGTERSDPKRGMPKRRVGAPVHPRDRRCSLSGLKLFLYFKTQCPRFFRAAFADRGELYIPACFAL